jgi:hypothetical protein
MSLSLKLQTPQRLLAKTDPGMRALWGGFEPQDPQNSTVTTSP